MRKFLAAFLLVPALSSAAVTATPVFPQTPNLGKAQILSTTGAISIASNAASVSNSVTVYTCGSNGSKITGLFAGTTDTGAHDVQVLIVNTSKVYLLTVVTVAASSGNVAGTYVVNLLSATVCPGLPVDSDGNPYLFCASGDTLAVGVLTTVALNKALTVMAVGSDF